MGTRSNLIIEDSYHRIQLYRHWNGYPEGSDGVLATLEDAFPYAWLLPRFEASDFSAAIIRGWKEGGGNIYIDGSPVGWELIHGDVEWVYIIKPKKAPKNPFDFLNISPIVEVYDWHPYWFDKTDPDTKKPKPHCTVDLVKAREVGSDWKQN